MRAGLAKAHAFAKEDPVNPTYDIVSGELYETAGRRGEALELLEKTVAARPSADALIEVLSSFCARAGDSGKAEAVLNIRLQTDPNDSRYRGEAGRLPARPRLGAFCSSWHLLVQRIDARDL